MGTDLAKRSGEADLHDGLPVGSVPSVWEGVEPEVFPIGTCPAAVYRLVQNWRPLCAVVEVLITQLQAELQACPNQLLLMFHGRQHGNLASAVSGCFYLKYLEIRFALVRTMSVTCCWPEE